MTTPTETPNLSQFSADPNHTSGMNTAPAQPQVSSGANIAEAPPVAPVTPVAAAPQVFVQPANNDADDERIARLEKRIREQDEAAAEAEIKNKYTLPADASDKFEEDTLNMMQKSALHALSTADGASIIEAVVRRMLPEILSSLETASENVSNTTAAQPSAPDLNSIFLQNFQMTWDQIKMLPTYSAYMAQVHQGRPVFEWVKQFADQGDMTNIIEFVRPLVEAARATQPPAPHAPVGASPGFVPAPAVGADDNANPDTMQFSEQKLAPLLKKASRGGWASLTADEQYILSTADLAASEGRVVQ